MSSRGRVRVTKAVCEPRDHVFRRVLAFSGWQSDPNTHTISFFAAKAPCMAYLGMYELMV